MRLCSKVGSLRAQHGAGAHQTFAAPKGPAALVSSLGHERGHGRISSAWKIPAIQTSEARSEEEGGGFLGAPFPLGLFPFGVGSVCGCWEETQKHGATVICEGESEFLAGEVAGVSGAGKWVAPKATVHSMSLRATIRQQEVDLGPSGTYLAREVGLGGMGGEDRDPRWDQAPGSRDLAPQKSCFTLSLCSPRPVTQEGHPGLGEGGLSRYFSRAGQVLPLEC